jgi:hypothetical protein
MAVDTYAYPHCPFRAVTHDLVARVPGLRALASAVWPAARRAERLELSTSGIAAWGLGGCERLDWADVTAVQRSRTPLGRRTLRVVAGERTIEVASMMPGFDELTARLCSAAGRPLAAR